MVDAALPLIDIIWRNLTARFNLRDPDQRAALSAEIKRLLATIKNSDVREAYATALRELYRGGGSRSNAAGGGMRAAAGNVALAVEAALVLGLVDHPGVIEDRKSTRLNSSH